jgi:hypothetical protein
LQEIGTLTEETSANPANKRVAVLAALVLLADILLFRQSFGINLFLFAVVVSAGILFSARTRYNLRAAAMGMGYAVFTSFPLVIGPSSMAMAVAIVAVMSIALAAARLAPRNPSRLPLVLCRFLAVAPLRLFDDARKRRLEYPKNLPVGQVGPGLRVWILPLVLATVFLILFAMANPVIDQLLRSINLLAFWRFLNFWRLTFWLLVAICVWALLRPRLLLIRKRIGDALPPAPASENILLSHASILRSLIIFNAMFGVQTLLDVFYLWGGADLPAGMTHAQYAHRGAYPLIATALMAGAFVLVAMRRGGPGDKSVAIRTLVHIWIGQNILLCLSAILRLDLYVEVYSLTELRIAAGIWMGLVAVGLGLILLRIVFRRSNEWLIAMNLASLTMVLYATAWIDIPAFIARFNVEHSLEVAHEGVPLDLRYLRSLGPSAIPALDTYISALTSSDGSKFREAQAYRNILASSFERKSHDWRSWSLRSAGMTSYLDANTAVLAIPTNNGIKTFGNTRYQLQRDR